ncbi:MAG TPA: HD domain-containing protein [Anaerovoracaceae bacterium]|nr:HD domain-containing protein [Anaerovoracaceae bacterium]
MADKHPSREDCMALLAQYHTPDHVIKHCIKVTDTALKIGQALNDKGCSLDLGLIQGAGLIHDIARVEEKHWEIGAKIAEDLGYYAEAEIIRVHMFYNCDPDKVRITETDVLCLADRMVKEDEYVGLDNRMQFILDKFQGNPEAFAHISERIRDNKLMIGRIEKILGVPIGSVV